MSVDATRSTWMLDKSQVTASEKLVLLSLADRADENHECWPGIKRLVADTSLDRKTIMNNLDILSDKGLIRIKKNCKGRQKRGSLYLLLYVQGRDDRSYPQQKPNKTNDQLNGPKNGTCNGPKNGTCNGPKNGTKNLSLETSMFEPSFKELRPSGDGQVVDKIKTEEAGEKIHVKVNLFKTFWDLYPKKTRKIRAMKEFMKIKAIVSVTNAIWDDISWRLENKAWDLTNKAFIADPDKYLRERHWEDERIMPPKFHESDKPYKRIEKSPYDSWPSVGIAR